MAVAQWTYFDNNADIRAIYQHGDTLWVGTNGGLVIINALTGEILDKITAGEFLVDNSVRAINGRSNQIYFGTDHGLSVLKGEEYFVYSRRESPRPKPSSARPPHC